MGGDPDEKGRDDDGIDPRAPSPHGYIHQKDHYLKRLRRIEGQARGLLKLVDDEKYCIDTSSSCDPPPDANPTLRYPLRVPDLSVGEPKFR